MTAFDDPKYLPTERDSALRAALSIARAQPLVVFVTIFAASTILALAALAWMAERYAADALNHLAESIKVSLSVNLQASRKDVDDLSARIKSIPFVGSVLLRPKDEAFASLERESFPLLRETVNPLPDVWIVSLKPTTFVGADPSFVTAFSRSQEVLAALPNVDSVTFDFRWVATLERWRKALSERQPLLVLIVTGPSATLLLLLFFLSGRALQRHPDSNVRALALVACAEMVVSIVGFLAITWMCESAVASVLDGPWKLYLTSGSSIDPRAVLTVAFGIAFLAFAGTILSVSRR